MMLKIDRQQRNHNFLEVVKAYNKAKSSADNDCIDSLYSLDLNLIGLESADKIYEALECDGFDADDNKSSLDLFYQDEGKLYFSLENKILPVSTKEEAGIIYSMLKKGDFDLYLTKDEKAILQKNINLFFENINTQPIDLYSFIEVKGNSLSADRLEDIKDKFDILKRAINMSGFVKITYTKNYKETFAIQPIELIYSQLDEKMRVKALGEDGVCRTYYLAFISDIELLKTKAFSPSESIEAKTKVLEFSFEDAYNLPERVAARFSDYKKEVRFNKKQRSLTYIVEYEDNPRENARILNRLRSLGKHINIKTAEKELIKNESIKALNQYK